MMTDKERICIKEYPLDSIKVSGIVSGQKGVHIWFTCDGEIGAHIWFLRLE
jgi:hypothetical protein